VAHGETEEFEGVEAKRETDKALLCLFPDGEEHWIPKSQIDDDSEVYREGDVGKLVVSQWIAEQKGLG
jgi:hypothetical protein